MRWLFWLIRGGFKVSLGAVEWYRSRCGTDFENSEMASPAAPYNTYYTTLNFRCLRYRSWCQGARTAVRTCDSVAGPKEGGA